MPGARSGAVPRVPAGPGHRAGRQGPSRPPEIDPARLAALELLTAVRVRDAYANLALPGDPAAARAARPRRGTGHRARLRHAARPRPARRRDRRVHRPAARTGSSPPCSTPCAWAPTSCCAPACRRTPRSTPPWSWCGWRRAPRSAGFVNAVLRRVGEHDEEAWVRAARARTPTEDPVGHAAFAHAHPRWIAQAFADALGARRTRSSTRRSPPTTPARRCTCSPGPVRSPPRSWRWSPVASRGAVLALRRAPRARRRRRRRARRRARGPRRPCRTRAASSWPWR